MLLWPSRKIEISQWPNRMRHPVIGRVAVPVVVAMKHRPHVDVVADAGNVANPIQQLVARATRVPEMPVSKTEIARARAVRGHPARTVRK